MVRLTPTLLVSPQDEHFTEEVAFSELLRTRSCSCSSWELHLLSNSENQDHSISPSLVSKHFARILRSLHCLCSSAEHAGGGGVAVGSWTVLQRQGCYFLIQVAVLTLTVIHFTLTQVISLSFPRHKCRQSSASAPGRCNCNSKAAELKPKDNLSNSKIAIKCTKGKHLPFQI